jgi:hypothetical protein
MVRVIKAQVKLSLSQAFIAVCMAWGENYLNLGKLHAAQN